MPCAGPSSSRTGGQPLKKVTVKLNPEDKENGTAYKAITDFEGRFKFEKVDAGDYTLTIERNGFLETGKQNGSHKLSLHPGDEVKSIVLRIPPSAVINGKILDNDGDPLPRVSVTVRKPGQLLYNVGSSARATLTISENTASEIFAQGVT